jgi:hypothetical protein
MRYLPMFVAGGPGWDRPRMPDDYSAKFVKLGQGVAFGFDRLAVR